MNCCFADARLDKCRNRRLGDLPMCDKHMRLTFRMALVEGALPADVFKVICQDAIDELGIRMQHNDARDTSAARRDAYEKREREGVVYYVQLTGGRVKIGWTRDLEARMSVFRARMEDVLATEPGAYNIEKRRHRQFASDRIGRTEEFVQSDRLMAHIARLAEQPV